MRKTKIICTLGPAVDDAELVRTLIEGGMDAARFNFSHGSHPEHLERLNRLKGIRDSRGRGGQQGTGVCHLPQAPRGAGLRPADPH